MTIYKGTNGFKIREDLRAVVDERPTEFRFVARKILPPVYVQNDAGKIPVIGAGATNLDPQSQTLSMPEGGTYKEFTWSFSDDTYSTAKRGLSVPVTMEDQARWSDFFDQEVESAVFVRNTLEADLENRVAQAALNETAYGTNVVTAGATWDLATSIIDDINNAADKISSKYGLTREQLTLILPKAVLEKMVYADAVLNKVKYVRDMATLNLTESENFIRSFLKLRAVWATSTSFNVAGVGSVDGSFVNAWDETKAILAYINPNVGSTSWRSPTFGRIPVWSKMNGRRPYVIESMDKPEIDSRLIRGRSHDGVKINYNLGVLIKGIA